MMSEKGLTFFLRNLYANNFQQGALAFCLGEIVTTASAQDEFLMVERDGGCAGEKAKNKRLY
ncbi:hypothetical protein HCH_00664 [Hahella chejuensis KCTC 2396]|uniref:Uncharacterized protein n=1 Tax=Hahella chejuensis (strain KCTC 2396) TaxID=349521 RepID=Q2SP60_HAHCH|nr:hypothetical protein HCH_00664 [Hahella chejuensis KCTC 2396]